MRELVPLLVCHVPGSGKAEIAPLAIHFTYGRQKSCPLTAATIRRAGPAQ